MIGSDSSGDVNDDNKTPNRLSQLFIFRSGYPRFSCALFAPWHDQGRAVPIQEHDKLLLRVLVNSVSVNVLELLLQQKPWNWIKTRSVDLRPAQKRKKLRVSDLLSSSTLVFNPHTLCYNTSVACSKAQKTKQNKTKTQKRQDPEMKNFSLQQQRKMEERLDTLAMVEGNGTSLISLYVPNSTSQQQRARSMIRDEKGLCTNIKDRLVGQAVQVESSPSFFFALCALLALFPRNILFS